MRLTPDQARLVRQNAQRIFGAGARVYLFGSRVDDDQRGGDIDIYIETDKQIPDRLEKMIELETTLIKALGDQKIDVVVKDPSVREQQIHRSARREGVQL